MKYTERMLRKILEALVPGVKKVLQILDSRLTDKEKLFQIRVAIWNAESDVQKEIQELIESQLFSPAKESENLPQTRNTVELKKHNVYNVYFLN